VILNEIIDLLKDQIVSKNIKISGDTELKNIKDNSEKVEENDIFVAIKGSAVDGHDYINTAYKKGAALIILENNKKLIDLGDINYLRVKNSRKALADIAYHFSDVDLNRFKTYAVTGTNGKSTSISLLHHLLREAKKNSSLLSTVEIKINDEVIDMPYNTTPSTLKIVDILEKSTEKNIDFVNFEVSSHAIAQKRIDNLSFDIVAYTNITRDHLDYHKDFKEYEDIKLSLVNYLRPNGKVIINTDNLPLSKFPDIPRENIITYGMSDEADFKIKDISESIYQMNFKITTPDGKEISIYSSIIGTFNAYNITNAAIAANLLGLSYEEIKHGVITFKGVPGRFQLVPSSKALGFSVVIDFAHTPDALEKVLMTAKKIVKGRVICVFGAGGNADKGKRKIMGEVVSSIADIIVLTTDDPKDEDPDKIVEDIKTGIELDKNFIVIPDRKTAINAAINFANREDIVIIAGRGHEKHQIFSNGKKVKFDDFEVAYECIENLRRSMKK